MTYFANPKQQQISCRKAIIVVASLAALIAIGSLAGAGSSRNERSILSVEGRAAGEPVIAIVSLSSQQITVYDANGWIFRAPVSSGRQGRETPAGIFSVIEKQAEHYSNLYDDAFMPHMQRLTWSGIALHGGVVPGHPASHGCIRMPYDFAERLFDATKLGMRVIVAPTDTAPVPISHPALFQPKPDAAVVAAARAAEADQASRKAEQARQGVMAASREVAQVMGQLRVMRSQKLRTEAQLAAIDGEIASAESAATTDQVASAKAKAAAKIAELEAQLALAEAESQPKLAALAAARETAMAAEAARVEAAEAAQRAARSLQPVSIFISRKTQRLYIRQAFRTVLDVPVTIRDPDLPIGTHVFTALEKVGSDDDMRWTVVSLVGRHPHVGTNAREMLDGHAVQPLVDPPDAKAALDRIVIPQATLDQITQMASPRLSLIISDEGLSSETGRGTDFVILMSGEPQGGLTHRRRRSEIGSWYGPPAFYLWR